MSSCQLNKRRKRVIIYVGQLTIQPLRKFTPSRFRSIFRTIEFSSNSERTTLKVTHPGTAVSLPSQESVDELFAESEATTSLIYTFPRRLIECFRTSDEDVGPSLLSEEAVKREFVFSKPTDHRDQVAFRREGSLSDFSIVNFRFLGDMPGPITPDFLRQAGSDHPVAAAEEFNTFFEPFYTMAQGYCGWLLQQEVYWNDLNSVLGLFGDSLGDGLLPQQALTTPERAELVEEPDSPTLAYKSFCEKWRLQGMVTLDLPLVVQPQLTARTIYTPNSYPGSVTPFLPDIFPVDAKGVNAEALENARMSIDAPHLQEWKSLISISSRKKKKIGTYARQFRLQHFWRVLKQRYPGQLHMRKSVIEEAFGRYFDVNSRGIGRESQELDILIDRSLSTYL